VWADAVAGTIDRDHHCHQPDATAGKSQTKSQRPQSPGHMQPRAATTSAAGRHVGPRAAICSHADHAPYKRGVAGSIPAAPTQVRACFRIYYRPLSHLAGNQWFFREPGKRHQARREARPGGPLTPGTMPGNQRRCHGIVATARWRCGRRERRTVPGGGDLQRSLHQRSLGAISRCFDRHHNRLRLTTHDQFRYRRSAPRRCVARSRGARSLITRGW
jgi:hypothetical protein